MPHRAIASIVRVQALAHHRHLQTTMKYIDGDANDVLGNRSARELHQFLLASATRDNPEVQRLNGLDTAAADAIIGKAKRKGFLGWQSHGDGQSIVRETESAFVQWMVGHEHMIVEDEYVAAEMIAFREHINLDQENIRATPAWHETWGPMLLLLNVALERMSPSVRLKGKKIATEFEICYADLN